MTTNKFTNNERGFTLLETLVAITILLIAVISPISFIGDSLHKLYYAKDEMVAINLAQEGIEVVRQKRDSDMLASSTTDIFSLASPSYYIIDANPATSTLTAFTVPQPIYLNNGFYEQSVSAAPAVQTQFQRLVTVSPVGASNTERQVTSTVTWVTGNATGTVATTEYLFKWAI